MSEKNLATADKVQFVRGDEVWAYYRKTQTLTCGQTQHRCSSPLTAYFFLRGGKRNRKVVTYTIVE